MSVYVVTWNLNKEKPNYSRAREAFVAQVNTFENVADSGLETVRFLSTSWSAHQISDDLRTKLDSNDRLFVSKLSSSTHQGWLDKATWDWINARM